MPVYPGSVSVADSPGPSKTRSNHAESRVINRRRQIQKFSAGLKCTCTGNESFVGREMTTGTTPKGQLMWLGLSVLVALLGLCTLFALVVTAAQAWQERAQARWPEMTARVDRCGLDQTSSGRREKYCIHCRLSYAAGAEQNTANVYSSNTPSPEIWQYPPNQIAPLKQWIYEHPPGRPIAVHYDPADHTKVALVANDMPRGGLYTPSNMKQLEVWAGSFLVLLMIARITRPRSLWQSGHSPTPLNP
jgi:hypothetical protein